jgi:hypothetical protein
VKEMSKTLDQSSALCSFFQDIHDQCKVHRTTLGRNSSAMVSAPLDLLIMQIQDAWDVAYANYERHKNDAEPA